MLTEDPEGQKMAETLIEVGIMGTKFILSKYITLKSIIAFH